MIDISNEGSLMMMMMTMMIGNLYDIHVRIHVCDSLIVLSVFGLLYFIILSLYLL